MPTIKRYNVSKGFSLLELLIVILIISMVYFLGFEGVEIGKQKPKALTPLNLKSNIISSELYSGEGTLLCIDQCRSCYFRPDLSSPFGEYTSPVDLTNIQAYTLDSYEALTPIEYGRYQDQQICLIMDFFKNGSSTQIILKNSEESYFLPAFFGEPQRFSTPEEAKKYWLRNTTLASDSGAFY
ncbi:prepilin-type N-terminal cleavage/methylation domain-containing protein [Sulfurovum sp. XGS-02]|uniref:prepilin-type N-terminal cleavage/methylation domain-containing protein n=1 Tax=Sulfurovum sp. XGS-02 TaxID=2925411 RepID=UPI002063C5F9|nr:prepilin-type N-terminal cleavage/methylation domain-containing protein [Sulfurovum sp. XGS-02]UPT77577.1 prepilin-type N-terminal cleavage/methylation domain-containing protein [Sulfurovum sp. XGS-02]